MSANFSFHGTGVALVTPFDKKGEVDIDALNRIVDHVIEGGVNFIVALGTTAETPVLSEYEQDLVVDTIKNRNNGRTKIVVGFGGNDTRGLIKKASNFNFDGIDGVLSVCPYYNRPTQDGMYAHFSALAQHLPTSIILYNVPSRTSSNLDAQTCIQLARDYANIVAVKEASGNLQQIMQIIKDRPAHFEVLSGDDMLTLPMIACGAKGIISVIANALPKEFTTMVNHCLSDSISQGSHYHYFMMSMMEEIFREGNPAGVKIVMELLGLCYADVRLPLVPGSNNLRTNLKRLLSEIKD
jgi:4-hydroxy-tetrahydrodipicolinate synthase